jgi:hypothetical protein
VAQLYRQALGSLFVASYYSQGYGGGIRNRRHAGPKSTIFWDVTPWKSTDVSEEHIASMFRIEEWTEKETSVKAGSGLLQFSFLTRVSSDIDSVLQHEWQDNTDTLFPRLTVTGLLCSAL